MPRNRGECHTTGFDADTGIEWGTGSFSFPTCSAGSFTFTPKQAMADMGNTEISYSLERILTSGIQCPTLVYDLE